MAEEKRDRLGEAIAKRRAEHALQEERAAAGLPAETPVSIQAGQKYKPDRELEKALTDVIQAITAGDNPIKVAMMLSVILAGGVKRKDVIERIAKSDAWLSKRLGLLKATKDIQRLIEAGELSEREYYNNRPNINQGIKGRGAALRYQRMPTITISIEAARALASILRINAEQHGDSSIKLAPNAGKKDITGLLDLRAGYVLGLIE
jgi:hypothetical protein